MASQVGQRSSNGVGEDGERLRSSGSRIPHLLSSPSADAAAVDTDALLQFIRSKHNPAAQRTQQTLEQPQPQQQQQQGDEEEKKQGQKSGEEAGQEDTGEQRLTQSQQQQEQQQAEHPASGRPAFTGSSRHRPGSQSHHRRHRLDDAVDDDNQGAGGQILEGRGQGSLGDRLGAEMQEWRQGIRAQVFHKHMVLQRFWQRWQQQRPQRRRQLANIALATSFHDALLMKRAFELWRRMQTLLHQRQADAEAADAFRRSMLMHGALRLWQRRLHLVGELRRLETQSHPHMQRVRLWLALCRWQHLSHKKRDLTQRERNLRSHALCLNAQRRLRQWRRRVAAVWEAYRRLARYQAEEQIVRQHRCLQHWRGKLALRRRIAQQNAAADAVAAGRRRREAFTHWRQAHQRLRRLQQIEGTCKEEVRRPRLLRFTLTQMRVCAEMKRRVRWQRETAERHYRHNLLMTAVAAWRLALDRREALVLQPLMLKAIQHRQHALTASAWLRWVRALAVVRRINPLGAIADHHRRQRVLPLRFRCWLHRARKQRHVRALEEAGSSFRCTHLARRALAHWHTVAVGRARERQLLPNADTFHAGTAKARAVRAWRLRLQQRRVAAAQMDVATTQHAGFRLRLAWTRWVRLLAKRRQLRGVEAAARAAHERHTMAVAWRAWRSSYAYRCDVDNLAQRLRARKEQGSMLRVWTLWRTHLAMERANRDAVVLADRQRQQHLQRRCLFFWRQQHGRQQRAMTHHRARLLRTSLSCMRAQFQRQQRRNAHLDGILRHIRGVRVRSTKAHVWRAWWAALHARQQHREQWQRAAVHHRTQMMRQGLQRLLSYARHRRRKRALCRRCEEWAEYRQKRAAFRRLRKAWLQQQHIHYMERLSLSMWAWHLRRKYFVRFVQRYRTHREISEKRQRVLQWRSHKLKRIGLQRILQAADGARVASATAAAHEGGERQLRGLRLARWAAYRWRTLVCRRRKQRGQRGEQRGKLPLWARGDSVVQLPGRQQRVALGMASGGGAANRLLRANGQTGPEDDDGDDISGEEPQELSSELQRVRARTHRSHQPLAFKGGAPPLWPGVLAPAPCDVGGALWPASSSHWNGVCNNHYEEQWGGEERGAPAWVAMGTHASNEGTGQTECSELQPPAREQGGHEGLLVKMKQVLQLGVDLRLEIASLEDLLQSWDEQGDTDMDRGEVEALLEQKRSRLKSVLNMCRRWRRHQQHQQHP